MKKILLGMSVLTLLSPAAFAAEKYTLDPAHTNVVWHANHFGFSNPSGKFADVKGTLELDEKDPAKSKLNVVIKSASISTGSAEFDSHLRKENFFNTDKFPEATFVSDKIIVTSKDNADVHGFLTLLGVTKPVVLKTRLNKIGESPITNKKTAGFSATAVIKRSEFGMTYAVPGVSDDVQLEIESEAILDAAPVKP